MEAAAADFALGTAGAGYGANSGGLKGGLGSASAVSEDGITVGALAAVNSLGSAIASGGKLFLAAPVELTSEFGGLGIAGLVAGPEDYGRALRPAHAPFDGDVVFALSTAQQEASKQLPRPVLVTRLGALAADTLARAIARAIYEATALPGSEVPAWRDL